MNIAVAQSGGPTVAINASLMGVFEEALNSPQINKIYGSLNGIEGIINDNLVVLNDIVKSAEDIELVKTTPATVLGSCRYKMPSPEKDSTVYEKIVETFKKYDIGGTKEEFGCKSNKTVINALRRFEEFVNSL